MPQMLPKIMAMTPRKCRNPTIISSSGTYLRSTQASMASGRFMTRPGAHLFSDHHGRDIILNGANGLDIELFHKHLGHIR